jgi:membrane-associated phospholipid phosphatase
MVLHHPDTKTSRRPGYRPNGTPARLLVWAAMATLTLGVLTILALDVGPAQSLDRRVLHVFDIGSEPLVVHRIAHSALPLEIAVLLGLAIAVALARRRPERALAAALLVCGAGATTEVLKTLLATTRDAGLASGHPLDPASFPSGHATATLSIVLAASLVLPRRLVPFAVVVGSAWTAAVAVAMLILQRHLPSDLIAGYLVALIWWLVILAALRAAELHPGVAGRMLPKRDDNVTRTDTSTLANDL